MLFSSRYSLSDYREYVWRHLIAVVPGISVGGRPSWAQVVVGMHPSLCCCWPVLLAGDAHLLYVVDCWPRKEGRHHCWRQLVLFGYLPPVFCIYICDILFWLLESFKNVLWFLQGIFVFWTYLGSWVLEKIRGKLWTFFPRKLNICVYIHMHAHTHGFAYNPVTGFIFS